MNMFESHRRKRSHLLMLIAASMLLATTSCKKITTKARTAAEIAEVVLTDTRELREEPRPVRGEQRLLIFAIDGLGQNEMQQILDDPELAPRISDFLGAADPDTPGVYEHAYAPPETLSILPSSTIAAWTSIFTGELPPATGITGNEFYLRDTETFYAIAPTSVAGRRQALEALSDGLLNKLISEDTGTLYEKADLRAHVSNSQVHRGADMLTTPQGALLELVTDTTVSPLTGSEVSRAPYAAIDEESLDGMREAWGEIGYPDIQTCYLPGLDLYSHSASDALEKQPEYMNDIVDPFVGKVLDEYADAGILEDTWVIFVSDHGHTPVKADKEHALEVEDFASILKEEGFDLRPPVLDVPPESYSAVLAAQGGLGYLYLADLSDCDVGSACDWTENPRWEEDVKPVVRRLAEANKNPEELGGKLEAILARDPSATSEPYKVWDDGRFISIAEWLESVSPLTRQAFLRRMTELTVGPLSRRVGDIILIPKYGMERPIEERFYFASPMRSEHGSSTVEDSAFTFVLSHPTLSGDELRQTVEATAQKPFRQTDIVPLALDILEVE